MEEIMTVLSLPATTKLFGFVEGIRSVIEERENAVDSLERSYQQAIVRRDVAQDLLAFWAPSILIAMSKNRFSVTNAWSGRRRADREYLRLVRAELVNWDPDVKVGVDSSFFGDYIRVSWK